MEGAVGEQLEPEEKKRNLCRIFRIDFLCFFFGGGLSGRRRKIDSNSWCYTLLGWSLNSETVLNSIVFACILFFFQKMSKVCMQSRNPSERGVPHDLFKIL